MGGSTIFICVCLVSLGVAEIGAWDPLEDLDEWVPDPDFKREGEGENMDEDSNGMYVGAYNYDCSESTLITPVRSASIDPGQQVLKTPGIQCHWDIMGTGTCIPVLECSKFDLAPDEGIEDDPCPNEYLEVTDGVEGYAKYCGRDGPVTISSTNNLRSLYINFKAGEGSNKRKLKCTVTCKSAGDGPTLPTVFEAETSESCNCGRKPNADRIVGGEDAKLNEFRWMAGLVAAKTRRPYCGGTVLNDRFIITAAHCFKGPYMKKKNFEVLLGGHFMDLTSSKVASGQGGNNGNDNLDAVYAEDEKQNSVRFGVEKYFIHPLYVRQTNDFDIALIKLDKPIDFEKYTQISPICLNDVSSYNDTYEGRVGVVAGWGLNSADASSTMGTLQKLDIKIWPFNECKDIFRDRFTSRMICAGYKEAGKDSCKGDSGGPLISEKRTQLWELIGAVSWGEGCANANSPGVYTKINEISQWVRYMANNEGAVWCPE